MLCYGHQFLFVICVRTLLYTRQLTIEDFVLIIFRHKNKKNTNEKNILHVLKYNEKPVLYFLKEN